MHIENLKAVYGEFNYAPYRKPFEPENETSQLQMFLPTYRANEKTEKPPESPIKSPEQEKDFEQKKSNDSDISLSNEEKSIFTSSLESTPKSQINDDSKMEGYGTDEDSELPDSRRITDYVNLDSDDDNSNISDKDRGVEPENHRNLNKVIKSNVCIRGGLVNSASKIKILLQQPENSFYRKRLPSCDEFLGSPMKIARKNSEQSDSSHLSGISDKVNKLDVPENMEVTMVNSGTKNIIPDKQKPVQVNVENNEFQIVPPKKISIVDKLMRKLSENMDIGQDPLENVKEVINISDEIMDKIKVPTESESEKEIIIGDVSEIKETNKEVLTEVLHIIEEIDTPISKEDTIKEVDNNEQAKTVESVIEINDNFEEVSPSSSKASICNDEKEVEVINEDKKNNSEQICAKLPEVKMVAIPPKKSESILEKQLLNVKQNKAKAYKQKNMENSVGSDVESFSSIEIKSEPNSENEISDNEYMEAKRQYLSALNISEKVEGEKVEKQNEIRTRSKTEEKTRMMQNVSKVIESVIEKSEKETTTPQKEPATNFLKQKARKSFPRPNPDVTKEGSAFKKNKLSQPIPGVSSTASIAATSNLMIFASQSGVNSIAVLPSNQQIAYSSNPVLAMVQQPGYNNILLSGSPKINIRAMPPLTVASKPKENEESQNTPAHFSVSNSTTTPTSSVSTEANLQTSTVNEDLTSILGKLAPENFSKTLTDTFCRAPPKLKKRPPGPLSTYFDEGFPSSSGPIAAKINSISHRVCINNFFLI